MEETPIGQGTSRYFTTAFLPNDEESTNVAMSDLAGDGLKENSSISLKSDQLDALLGQFGVDTETAHPTEGVMIELDPPTGGLQTDTDKLLLWFDGKSNAFNVSGNLVCERQ